MSRATSTSNSAPRDASVHNGVTPFGDIDADPTGGTLVGNRGCLVYAEGRPVEPFWEHEHWITCRIFPEPDPPPVTRRRQYTELSFLDEATACAAGHRPCFQCRYSEANAFRAKWREVYSSNEGVSEIVARLHRER